MKARLYLQILCAIALLATGFIAGSRYKERSGSIALQKIVEPYKAEMTAALAGMSAKEIKEMLQQIKIFSRSVVQESNQQILFEAMMSQHLLAIKQGEGDAAAWDLVKVKLDDFKKRVSEPNYDAGGWTKVARALEKRLNTTEPSQP